MPDFEAAFAGLGSCQKELIGSVSEYERLKRIESSGGTSADLYKVQVDEPTSCLAYGLDLSTVTFPDSGPGCLCDPNAYFNLQFETESYGGYAQGCLASLYPGFLDGPYSTFKEQRQCMTPPEDDGGEWTESTCDITISSEQEVFVMNGFGVGTDCDPTSSGDCCPEGSVSAGLGYTFSGRYSASEIVSAIGGGGEWEHTAPSQPFILIVAWSDDLAFFSEWRYTRYRPWFLGRSIKCPAGFNYLREINLLISVDRNGTVIWQGYFTATIVIEDGECGGDEIFYHRPARTDATPPEEEPIIISNEVSVSEGWIIIKPELQCYSKGDYGAYYTIRAEKTGRWTKIATAYPCIDNCEEEDPPGYDDFLAKLETMNI